jgi:hypothetical protein
MSRALLLACNRGYNQGGDHALDYIRGTSGFVGVRFCQRLRHWRIHSPTFGNRRGGTVDSVDPREKFNLSDQLV